MKILKGVAQTYKWGKIGTDSEVYALLAANGNSNLDKESPYAELWMGSHPSGPSTIIVDGKPMPLKKYIEENPEKLGTGVMRKFGNDLPFLFKVLSVQKALSIQAHPNKSHAEELHTKKPEIYKDANHKPEMAIALTPFEALCGFRGIDEVIGYLHSLPALVEVVGEKNAQELRSGSDKIAALKDCFTALMTCPHDKVSKLLQDLLHHLNGLPDQGEELLGSLLRRLHSEFPGDVGCFCIYFMNYIILQPGDAIFLKANLIHAYLKGDCIEVMACSDNVVRAGLTPKFKDVETLCSMLEYEPHTALQTLHKPVKKGVFSEYAPPVPDFAVQKIDCKNGVEVKLNDVPSASIILVIQGSGTIKDFSSKEHFQFHRGSIFFCDAKEKVMLQSEGSEHVLMFRAFCDVL